MSGFRNRRTEAPPTLLELSPELRWNCRGVLSTPTRQFVSMACIGRTWCAPTRSIRINWVLRRDAGGHPSIHPSPCCGRTQCAPTTGCKIVPNWNVKRGTRWSKTRGRDVSPLFFSTRSVSVSELLYARSASILAARIKSLSLRPPILWVQIWTPTRPHARERSGW